jgi:hypothetical protein
MTYCNQPQWLSAYTYAAIRHQLLIENPGFVQEIRIPLTRPMLAGPLVHVVAALNLTKRTGSIDYVSPVTRANPSSSPNSRAELIVRDAAGKELFRQSVAIQETTDTQVGEDRTALIDATLPFRDDMARIQLELDGTVLAEYANERTTPPAVSGVKIARQAGARNFTLNWNAPATSVGRVTYTVLAPEAGNRWVTIAVGLTEPTLALSIDQSKLATLRLSENNGFRTSPPVDVHLCPRLVDPVLKLEMDVQTFQEALDNGEIPPPPKTPASIARARAQLRNLQRSLANAAARLAQCQAQNP